MWDEEYRIAAQAHRWARRDEGDEARLGESKRNLRKTGRKSKAAFFRKKLDEATTGNEVFRMAGWHKSTGSFRSPPLRDPMNPGSEPAVTLATNREVLARNLLQNVAEAEGIPMDTP